MYSLPPVGDVDCTVVTHPIIVNILDEAADRREQSNKSTNLMMDDTHVDVYDDDAITKGLIKVYTTHTTSYTVKKREYRFVSTAL
jgi:hypothetical protein